MNVLVLGGSGWVGHSIACVFAEAGYDVIVCSRGHKSEFLQRLPAGIPRIRADKSHSDQMAAVFENTYDIVIDSVPTEASMSHVCRFARKLKRYVHCSSTGGYAPLPVVPGDETLPYDEFMGGWKNKAVVDAHALHLWLTRGFPATVIRPSYITGPGRPPLDNLGGRRTDFIPDILNGKTLDLPNDGQALLQPIHVQDLARSFLLAAEKECSIGQIYNICLEKAVPIRRYIEITAAALDREAKINLMPIHDMVRKYDGVCNERGLRFFATHMCFDISKARAQLGYEPRDSTEAAIEETARWVAAGV